eukprot:CAMPEP_0181234012 /NCGR_PEP_ID=MMETSP1096-20121128/36694_1 /TAXON_ID=156174 ORGANISM="Chrysochromulina ericina, Strain CCMP281" /NCGR_SAMPLE_ID=MMETSP1096 /ASSEMBLY_ACC=CAM_ASM_000453 /LENGTH=89 /DNA_ID=CAMNT_0023328655 /DNA_START=770 /DNA_END=1036 /DNA_ORIENTATION=+
METGLIGRLRRKVKDPPLDLAALMKLIQLSKKRRGFGPPTSRLISERPPLAVSLNLATVPSGMYDASAPSTGSADQCANSDPWLASEKV